jgi:hypothetical protein
MHPRWTKPRKLPRMTFVADDKLAEVARALAKSRSTFQRRRYWRRERPSWVVGVSALGGEARSSRVPSSANASSKGVVATS